MKSTKKLLIFATLLIALGAFMAILPACDSNFFTKNYQSATHEITEQFDSISMSTDTADIEFAKSEDQTCKVVCYENKNLQHTVFVEDNTLKIKVVDTRKWYQFISFGVNDKVTIYLSQSQYSWLKIKEDTGNVYIPADFSFDNIDLSLSTGDVKCLAQTSNSVTIKTSTGNVKCVTQVTESLQITASTGNITLQNATADNVKLKVSTGKISVSNLTCGDLSITVSTGKTYLKNINCTNLTSTGNTGDITLTDVIATQKFSIKRTTGDVEFARCDADEITIVTDTGDVEGSLLSPKIFTVDTNTGKKKYPRENTTGGPCRITTDTGDISIKIEPIIES